MTWTNKEVRSKYHSNKIILITDFGDMSKAKEWRERIENETKQIDKSDNKPDFQK
jgi:hypothetical protein